MQARLLSLMFLFMLVAPARPEEPATIDAQIRDLVRSLRVQAIFEATNRHTFLHNPRMQSLPDPVRNCAAEALRYFGSRAGYLNIMLSIRQGRANLEASALLAEADAAGEPGKSEMHQIEEYLSSPLAGKFRQIDIKARSERIPDIGTPKLMAQCAKQP